MSLMRIKGMYGDVTELAEPLEVHLAQAKCYAYVFSRPRIIWTALVSV